MTTSALTPLRALLLEDNEDDALILGRHLRQGGYELDFERVETPVDFEEALDRGGWDVVFADYVLPHVKDEVIGARLAARCAVRYLLLLSNVSMVRSIPVKVTFEIRSTP